MTGFQPKIARAIQKELAAASRLARERREEESFRHLERAHILGQSSTVSHLRVHWRMLVWGWRRKDVREVLGQILRIAGAAVATPFGLLPRGNTGGAKVSAFQPMPIPPDLEKLLP